MHRPFDVTDHRGPVWCGVGIRAPRQPLGVNAALMRRIWNRLRRDPALRIADAVGHRHEPHAQVIVPGHRRARSSA